MLGPHDSVDWMPRRIAIAGVAGAGKTTLATRIAAVTGLPHTEIDGLHHGPGWTKRPTFEAEVDALTSRSSWVTEWQYRTVRELIAARADTMVWLDLPWPVVLSRVIRRTVRRRRTREVLWNGNTEGPLTSFFTDPDHIVRWAIRTRRKYDRMVPEAQAAHPHLRVVRLRSRRDVDTWLANLIDG